MGKPTIEAMALIQKAIGAKSEYNMSRITFLDHTSIRRYTKGKVSITLDTLNRLCEENELEMTLTFDKKQ